MDANGRRAEPDARGYGKQDLNKAKRRKYGGAVMWEVGMPNASLYHLQFTNVTQQDAFYDVSLTGFGSITPYPVSLVSLPVSNPPAAQPVLAQAGAGAPLTLPVTGGNLSAFLGIFGVSVVLIAAGLAVRRRSSHAA